MEQPFYNNTPDEFCAAKWTCPEFDDEACHVSGWGGDGCYIPWAPPKLKMVDSEAKSLLAINATYGHSLISTSYMTFGGENEHRKMG